MQALHQAAPAAAVAGRVFRRRAASSAAPCAVHRASGLSCKRSAAHTGAAMCQQRLLSRAFSRAASVVRAARVSTATTSGDDDHMRIVAEKVASAARNMKTLSWVGFWGQLILSTVSAVIIVFSIVFKGVTKGTDAGLYFVLFGLLGAFLSVFWSMGYSRLAAKLKRSSSHPEQAPSRNQVIASLTSGVTINMVGLGSSVIGLQATTGLLFAKTLSVAAQNPYLSGGAYNPVLALDIFLVQAAANVLLSHFIGAAVSLWLLRKICD